MKKIQTYIAAFILLAMSAAVLMPIASVNALGPFDRVCADDNSDTAVCKNKNDSSDSLVNNIVNTLLFVVGALSVLMIIIGGLLYVTSQGDSGSVTKAKNTVLYAVIGLIVALLAYAIVNWLFDRF
ncbi:MAG: hypothetical protein JWO54_157 [Candidatus Saccharibacteria bacterium]|nr:hypothetical protein [Candidatus Saccharibacteria bacterium]MDB5180399.1 hypothetical protein [Candidatus Saccharibacteria bacterium]